MKANDLYHNATQTANDIARTGHRVPAVALK
jgi:hypothetical protein